MAQQPQQQKQRRRSSVSASQLTFQLQSHPSQHNPYNDTMSALSTSPPPHHHYPIPGAATSPPAFPGSPQSARSRTSSVPQPKVLQPFVPESERPEPNNHGEVNGGQGKSSGVRALLLENVRCQLDVSFTTRG
jgi:hypothetical protein